MRTGALHAMTVLCLLAAASVLVGGVEASTTARAAEEQTVFVLGVDVGGTNTDCVLLRVQPDGSKKVMTGLKTSATSDVSSGIHKAIQGVLRAAKRDHGVDASAVYSVTIGTTHFVNAAIQRAGLQRVAVMRLCGPASTALPPLTDWPADLRRVVAGPAFFVAGGFMVSGEPIAPLDEAAVRAAVREAHASGINSFAVTGVFTHLDDNEQERAVGRVIEREWGVLEAARVATETAGSDAAGA